MEIEDWVGRDNQIGIDIWQKKYCHCGETFDHWLDRIAEGNSDVRRMLAEKKFLFGGRILANRGLHKAGIKVTYSNCYVLTPPEDSIESIFEAAGKLARTFSYGGGVGIDLTKLAPRGAKINNTASETSGSVSFTDLYSMVTGLIGQHGRRGALMLTISCEHPDTEEFMNVKTDLERVTKANMSIRMTDEFMRAVRDNEIYTQTFIRPETDETIRKDLDANAFFKKLCSANWDYGEPGCLFWDRISNWNMLSEFPDFEYAGTNPCAEEPLPPGGSCLLGSLNLAAFVNKDGMFMEDEFKDAVRISVRGLNEVLDEGLPLHPLEEQRRSVTEWRQIGLGIMGLAEMMIKLRLKYGSQESIEFCDKLSFMMADTAINESAVIASEVGMFSKCVVEQVLASPYFMENTTQETRDLVAVYGLRNSQLMTIAPTGTISTMLGISGGIEPIFANYYERRTVSLSSKDDYYRVYTPVVKEFMEEYGYQDDSELPDYFTNAQILDYEERIDMQSIWQNRIDASISSTINLPKDFPEEDVEKIYMYAWEKGCKGITVFRDGCKRDSILTPKKSQEEERLDKEAADEERKRRGSVLEVADNVVGKKRKLTTGCGSLHCTAFFDPESGDLVEAYLNKGSTGGCNNFMIGLSRMISLAARSGCDVYSIVDQLKSCGSCPSYTVRTFTKHDTSKGSCCPAAIGYVLVDMWKEMQVETKGVENTSSEPARKIINPCPKCGSELEFQGGCNVCKSCGWTKCD